MIPKQQNLYELYKIICSPCKMSDKTNPFASWLPVPPGNPYPAKLAFPFPGLHPSQIIPLNQYGFHICPISWPPVYFPLTNCTPLKSPYNKSDGN